MTKYIFSINGSTVTEDEFNKVYRELGGHWVQKGCDFDGTIRTTKMDNEGKWVHFKETPITK